MMFWLWLFELEDESGIGHAYSDQLLDFIIKCYDQAEIYAKIDRWHGTEEGGLKNEL